MVLQLTLQTEMWTCRNALYRLERDSVPINAKSTSNNGTSSPLHRWKDRTALLGQQRSRGPACKRQFRLQLSPALTFRNAEGRSFCSCSRWHQQHSSRLPMDGVGRKCSKHWRTRATSEQQDTSAEGELDLAVFRFTLGIPGFDDGDLPRVVGVLVGLLLLLNHVFSPGITPAAQGRSEAVGTVLAGLAIAVPTVGRRLKEARRGKAGAGPTGRRQVFALRESLSEDAQKEIAWTTYAILRNTTTTAVFIWLGNEVLCARGCLDNIPALSSTSTVADAAVNSTSKKAALLADLSRGLRGFPEGKDSIRQRSEPFYIPTGAGSNGVPIVSTDAASLLFQPFLEENANGANDSSNNRGGVLLVSGNARAYGPKDRAWLASLASKLASFLLVANVVA